jgi:pyridoxine 5-phosphate synthase
VIPASSAATSFSANLNKIALLRNTRDNGVPDLVHFSRIALAAGAASLTLHPRPDQRHARAADVRTLRRLTRDHRAELNIEGYPSDDFLALVTDVRPDQCTLVPDEPGQRTSDHGWDCSAHHELLKRVSARLVGSGIRVSLFLDPEPWQVPHAKATGAQRIELYTEPYARSFGTPEQTAMIDRYRQTAAAAQAVGLAVNAGHDLSLANLDALLTGVPGIAEVSIGHAMTAEALEFGLGDTVRRYVAICQRDRR